jgi:hypothetical protein
MRHMTGLPQFVRLWRAKTINHHAGLLWLTISKGSLEALQFGHDSVVCHGPLWGRVPLACG